MSFNLVSKRLNMAVQSEIIMATYTVEKTFRNDWYNPQALQDDDGKRLEIQWNLSETTTSMIRFISCNLYSNVF